MNIKLSKNNQEMITARKENLSNARKRKGLSQSQLYDLLFPDNDKDNKDKNAIISTWETQRGTPKKHIDQVAHILDVTADYLSGTDHYMNLSDKMRSLSEEAYSDTLNNIEFFTQLLKRLGHEIKPCKCSIDKNRELIEEDSSGVFSATIQHVFEEYGLDKNEYIFAVKIDNNVYDIGTFEKMINATLTNIETITENTLMVAKKLRKKQK